MKKKTTHGDLIKIDRQPYFYLNPISKKIYYRKSINGKRVKISSGVTSIVEAKKIVDDRLIDLFSSNPTKEKREKKGIRNPLIKDVWNDLIEERRPSREQSTLDNYRVSWEYGIREFWSRKTVNQISEHTITEFENWYLKNYPKRTFFNTHKHFSMLLNYCLKMGYITKKLKINNIESVIIKNTRRKKVGRVYSDSEIRAILENSSPRTKIGVLFGRYLGMRKMEVLGLKWENIDLKSQSVDVWSSKNKKWRKIHLPNFFNEELKIWKTECGSSTWVFPNSDFTNNIPSQEFDKGWKRAQKLAKIEGWNVENSARFHDLRHTFASQTAAESWPPMHACAVLDMSLKEYQRTYVHVSAFDIKKAMEKTFGKGGV